MAPQSTAGAPPRTDASCCRCPASEPAASAGTASIGVGMVLCASSRQARVCVHSCHVSGTEDRSVLLAGVQCSPAHSVQKERSPLGTAPTHRPPPPSGTLPSAVWASFPAASSVRGESGRPNGRQNRGRRSVCAQPPTRPPCRQCRGGWCKWRRWPARSAPLLALFATPPIPQPMAVTSGTTGRPHRPGRHQRASKLWPVPGSGGHLLPSPPPSVNTAPGMGWRQTRHLPLGGRPQKYPPVPCALRGPPPQREHARGQHAARPVSETGALRGRARPPPPPRFALVAPCLAGRALGEGRQRGCHGQASSPCPRGARDRDRGRVSTTPRGLDCHRRGRPAVGGRGGWGSGTRSWWECGRGGCGDAGERGGARRGGSGIRS